MVCRPLFREFSLFYPPTVLQGINPKIRYTMQPLTGSSKLYHITQDGIVIAKTDRLRAFDRHILEVTVVIVT